MSEALPEPPVPIECDCTDLDGFMLNVERLMASELVALASHEQIGAALFLWCRAWKQIPAASLPDDENVLAAFAKLPLPRFRKLRPLIMRGFQKCSDGRFYHCFLAKEALKAYRLKLRHKDRRETEAERLREWRANKSRTEDETRFVPEGQGQDRDRTGTIEEKEPSLRSGSSAVAPKSREPAAPLSAEWTPEAGQRAYASKLGLGPDEIDREAVKFRGYFTDGKGAGKRRNPKGWRQSWQNWIGKTIDRPLPASNGAHVNGEADKTQSSDRAALIARVVAKERKRLGMDVEQHPVRDADPVLPAVPR